MAAIIVLIVLAVMWALLAVPRQREARRHNAVLASLEVGDEVMTGGGLFGTITEMGDDHVLLEIAPGTVVKFTKRAVATRVDADPPPPSAADTTVGSTDRSED
jgi:preprotein translocase subunit YajC